MMASWHGLCRSPVGTVEADDFGPQRDDPALLRQAAELVTAFPDDQWRYSQPVRFSSHCFGEYLVQHQIPWPRLPSGALCLDEETFRERARAFPAAIGPLRELLSILSQLRLPTLAVGGDARNRVLLGAFSSKSSRNQPSTSKYIFGPSTWIRSLITPAPGMAIAYIDWSQQELAIASYLSRDEKMLEAYASGDFYIEFAKMAKAAPVSATKQSHPEIREAFKTMALGVLYGMSAYGLAQRLGIPLINAKALLRLHHKTFQRFWRWSDGVVMQGELTGQYASLFGWPLHRGPRVTPRTWANFPMQSNGAEMLRIAACLATEQQLKICALVHDAMVVEDTISSIDDTVRKTQAVMAEASELVLPNFPLRSEAVIVRHPNRYSDVRGVGMWNTVMAILAEVESESQEDPPCSQKRMGMLRSEHTYNVCILTSEHDHTHQ